MVGPPPPDKRYIMSEGSMSKHKTQQLSQVYRKGNGSSYYSSATLFGLVCVLSLAMLLVTNYQYGGGHAGLVGSGGGGGGGGATDLVGDFLKGSKYHSSSSSTSRQDQQQQQQQQQQPNVRTGSSGSTDKAQRKLDKTTGGDAEQQQQLTCGCPETCDERALRYSNGHYRCETRIKFLMDKYHATEEEACASASNVKSYDGNPPCDTRCTPGVCEKHPPRNIGTIVQQKQDNTSINCGCPASCTEQALKNSNGHHSCGVRIDFLMSKYHASEMDACSVASDGENPPCDQRCKPDVCQSQSASEGGVGKQKDEDDHGHEEVTNCGCPETCDDTALANSNGYHICGDRIQFLMKKYKAGQLEACVKATEGDNPPCDTSCKPDVCFRPEQLGPIKGRAGQSPPQRIDCGCPNTCDELAQDYTNGFFVCRDRLHYLMGKYHLDEIAACTRATDGDNPACDTSCKPGICKTPDPPLTLLEERERNVTVYDPNAPPKSSLLPWSNLTSLAQYTPILYSGYRNQMAVFTILILECIRAGHGQFLIETLTMKDTYGSNKQVPFEELWDVEHWNSHYPKLPRLVKSDPVLHDQFHAGNRGPPRDADGKWMFLNGSYIPENVEASRPYYWGVHHLVLGGFMRYSAGKGPYVGPRRSANPADVLMQQGALRLHPDMQAVVDNLLDSIKGDDGQPLEYMTLHARVEPDMQRHGVCRDRKVYNLTEIVRFVEEKWPEPPVPAVFLPINREILEEEGYPNKKHPEKTNWIAVENLRALDDVLENGMWGGRVKVFRFGANVMKGTKYENRPSISGAMVAYFIALNCKIFIGTTLSSYSHAIVTTRFHRKELENYEYLPDGLHQWTPPGSRLPPPFEC